MRTFFPHCTLMERLSGEQNFVSVCVELDLGLKKEVLGSNDGSSSLEALLRGEPLEKRSALELRPNDEEPAHNEYTSGGLNPATRVRKVTLTLAQ